MFDYNIDTIIRVNLISFRLICGVLLISSVVISTMYSATFTSQVAVPNFKVLANSLEDVAADSRIEAFVLKGSPTDEYFQVCIYIIC